MNHITHILSSPLQRTMGTALLLLQNPIQRGIKIWAIPELQSRGSGPNNKGKDLNAFRAKYGDNVDCRFMCEDWNDPKVKAQGKLSKGRIEYLRNLIHKIGVEQDGLLVEIALVSHSSILG